MKLDFFKIKTHSTLGISHPGFDAYVESMETVVKEIIPETVLELHDSLFIPIGSSFQRLSKALPILQLSDEKKAPCVLSLRVLVKDELIHGVGPFLCRMIEEKLLPGKRTAIKFLRSLSFDFIIKPTDSYYIIEFFIDVESLADLQIIQKKFPRFEEEVRLTTLGVERARKLVLAKRHSLEEKQMILLENFTSFSKGMVDFNNAPLFEDVQRVLLRGIQEQNPDKIPDHLLPFIDEKPHTFDHHIFHEFEHLSILFQEDFSQKRSLSHLSKTLSYLYLFRKIITYSIHIKPEQKRLSFKLIHVKVEEVPTLAMVIGINLSEAHETLREEDVLKAAQTIIPSAQIVPESTAFNEEGKNRVCILYLEIQKKDQSPFDSTNIKLMKKKMPKLIRQAIEQSKQENPFLRADEETTRNILNLTKEMKSIHEPARIIIQYHNQTPSHIRFSVILSRLQEPGSSPLSLSSSPPLVLQKAERKVVGILRKRYIKEIYLFDIMIQKNGKTLGEARSAVVAFFKSHLHKLHDFNGEVVTRKYENLAEFKSLLENPPSDALVENYFYSISPPFMQILTPPQILKNHFNLILKALDYEFLNEGPLFLDERQENYNFIVVSSPDTYCIDQIKKKGKHFSEELTLSYLKVFDLHLIGFILPKRIDMERFLIFLKEESLTTSHC